MITMSYHVHNALKFKVLLAIDELSKSGKRANLNKILEHINTISKNNDVTKKKLAPNLVNYVKNNYLHKKKYKSPVERCQYYYELTAIGKKTVLNLYSRVENHQTLNLRKAPEPLESGYVKGREFDEERERKRKDKTTPILKKKNELIFQSMNMGNDPTEEEKEKFNALNQEFNAMIQKAIA